VGHFTRQYHHCLEVAVCHLLHVPGREFLCQLSILAFYLRIMIDPKLRLAVWVLMGLVACFGLGNTFAMIFQCMPIPFFWDGWRGEMSGSCGVNVRLFGFVRGGVEIFLDLAILILPLLSC
jgi:hypothetical protein